MSDSTPTLERSLALLERRLAKAENGYVTMSVGDLSRIYHASGNDERWQTSVPQVEQGREKWFIVTVRRAHREQPFTFPALYLNGMTLNYDEEPYEQNAVGWFSPESDGDDGRNYRPLLNHGDELLGWCDLPTWPAIARTQEQSDG